MRRSWSLHIYAEIFPPQYWILFVQLFNKSFDSCFLPSSWKDVRIILLAKKESICAVANTRPISLLDIFLKLIERLFLTRFLNVLNRQGILPDTVRLPFQLQVANQSTATNRTDFLLDIEQLPSGDGLC